MGKIKRERQKFHITSTVDDDGGIPDDTSIEVPKYTPLSMAPMQLSAGENIFAGINIQLDAMNKFSEPKPATSIKAAVKKSLSIEPTVKFAPPSTSQPERQLTKKEKMKMRHEKLLQKIDVIQQAKRKHEKKTKKTKTAAVSVQPLAKPMNSLKLPQIQPDASEKRPFCSLSSIHKELVSLNDSLPSLDTVFRMKSKDAKTGLDQPMMLKSKQRKQQSKIQAKLNLAGIQSTSKAILKDAKKEAKKEYIKSYDLFRKLLKTAKTASNPAKLPKEKKYPKKIN